MHYYKRNLGDYAKKAGRLSMLQHGAYTLLIDSCYDREQFPTKEEAIEWTWASSTAEIEAVEFVLRKFFTFEDGVYVQKRIQEEIAEYHTKSETNKRIAIERETKRKEKSTNRVHDVNEPPPNQEPRTKNQEPLTSKPIKPKDSATPIPEWVDEALWRDFKSHRVALKARMTPRAEALAMSDLAKLKAEGNNPSDVIKQSIMRGWKGLFALNGNEVTKGQTRHEKLAEHTAILTGQHRRKQPADDPTVIHGTAERLD